MSLYELAVAAALAAHLSWILWVMLGWLMTRHRPILRWLHILSLIYGILIEVLQFPCPLTVIEQWLRSRAGINPFRESFLVHYLGALVYPDIAPAVLIWSGIVVCVLNLAIYAARFSKRTATGW